MTSTANARWFSLVMNAAASIEDAGNCLRDPDAKRSAEGAAKFYRDAGNALWSELVRKGRPAMTRTERLARIGEHAQKWVRLEAEKEAARKENARAWLDVCVEIDERLYPAVKRGTSNAGNRGYFWTDYADQFEGGGKESTPADSHPLVQGLVETWDAYSKAKIAAGNARAVVTKACRALEKAK